MSSQPIIEKIKKLLALSQSSNVNEASLAAARAQELMTKYRIETAELNTSTESSVEAVENDVLMESKSDIPWKSMLATGLAKTNGCHVYTYYTYGVDRKQTGANIRIVGTASSAGVVRYMFAYLVREIDRLANEVRADAPYVGRSWLRSFRIGAVSAIVKRMKETSEKTIEESASSSALVVINNEAERVKDVLSKIKLRAGNPTRISDVGAFAEGHSAGMKVNLSSGPGLGKGSAGSIKE